MTDERNEEGWWREGRRQVRRQKAGREGEGTGEERRAEAGGRGARRAGGHDGCGEAHGAEGFTADFAEYTPGMEQGDFGIRFLSDARRIPPPLDTRSGLLVAGTNRSDDLFMYIYRPVTELTPGQRYRVDLEITFATNVPADCVGVGGSPGEGVLIKAGATNVVPAKRTENNLVVTNIDKGNQGRNGREMIVIGDFSGGGGTCNNGEYRLKSLSTSSPPASGEPPPQDALLLTADNAGQLWIVIGTDSGFEGRTEIYYLEGSALLTPV
ncbi:hypothetical protein J4558_12740 [Leptolyngbya sp. 15MV]|nr:hypothetical protein J4558_12740 [Leptolyngbya sp. 15MV]